VGDDQYKGECTVTAQFLGPGLATLIAIFDSNGRYIGTSKHSHSHGVAHTALYVGQSAIGIEIVHQFKSASCPNIKDTLVRFDESRIASYRSGVSPNGGTFEDVGENYYVVE
jgi:hypothetical protein